MEEKENAKKLGLILVIILLIIILILTIAFISTSMPIRDSEDERMTTTTTTTRPFNYGFDELEPEAKRYYNEILNNERLVMAFANATYLNRNLRNINLIGSEAAKFKFIYTYINLDVTNPEPMKIEEINEHANIFFGTNLEVSNLEEFAYQNGFRHEIIDLEINYCYRATMIQGQTLLINIVHQDSGVCEPNHLEHQEDDIINIITMRFNNIQDNYMFHTYLIIR